MHGHSHDALDKVPGWVVYLVTVVLVGILVVHGCTPHPSCNHKHGRVHTHIEG